MTELIKKLKAIEVKRKPFVNRITEPGVYHWVKPKVVASFKFASYTKNNRIRKPAIYRGLVDAMEIENVTWEPPTGKPSSDLFFKAWHGIFIGAILKMHLWNNSTYRTI